MLIDVNIYTMKDALGRVLAYEPNVKIASDCQEHLDPIALERLSKTLENAIRDGIEEARIKEGEQ